MDCEQQMIRKMQIHQLSILRAFKDVCDRNSITFYLAFGTALGARRHHGFIPWDDDIDLYMSIEELVKFEKVKDQLPANLFFQTRETDPDFGLLIARIRDSCTTLIEDDHKNRDINQGVYIDIYPLFNAPKSVLGRGFMRMESFVCRLFAFDAPPSNKGRLITLFASLSLRLFSKHFKMVVTSRLYGHITNRKYSGLVSNFPDISLGRFYKDTWFKEPSKELFENEMMPVPTDNDAYLAFYFGDYMTLPPVEMRKIHHNYLFCDLDTPYIEYKGIHYCN